MLDEVERIEDEGISTLFWTEGLVFEDIDDRGKRCSKAAIRTGRGGEGIRNTRRRSSAAREQHMTMKRRRASVGEANMPNILTSWFQLEISRIGT